MTLVNTHKILELNADYLPMGVVSLPDAFRKVARESAVFLDHADQFIPHTFETWTELSELRNEFEKDDHRWIPTPSIPVLLPHVIKLVDYRGNPKRKVPFTRSEIYIRDGYKCCYCGKKFLTSDLNLDHVIPLCQGGKTNWTNIACCCQKCNLKKGGRTPQQAGMKLLIVPKEPKWSIRHILPKRINHESWKSFLPSEIVDAMASEMYWNTELENDMEK